MSTLYKIFYNEIPKILINGPKTHREIAERIKRSFPETCDDSIPCPHVKDKSCHPEWDHIVRNAEQGLKRKDIIKYDYGNRRWELA